MSVDRKQIEGGLICDMSELDELSKQLIKVAQKEMPQAFKKFLREKGGALRKRTAADGVKAFGTSSGKHRKDGDKGYHKNWKRGRVYYDKNSGQLLIRVYNSSRYAHILEHGRRRVKNGVEYFQEGKYVLKNAAKKFEPEFYSDMETLAGEVLDQL